MLVIFLMFVLIKLCDAILNQNVWCQIFTTKAEYVVNQRCLSKKEIQASKTFHSVIHHWGSGVSFISDLLSVKCLTSCSSQGRVYFISFSCITTLWKKKVISKCQKELKTQQMHFYQQTDSSSCIACFYLNAFLCTLVILVQCFLSARKLWFFVIVKQFYLLNMFFLTIKSNSYQIFTPHNIKFHLITKLEGRFGKQQKCL